MLRSVLALFVFAGAILAAAPIRAANPSTLEVRKTALQALNEFVGSWKSAGGPDKPRPGPRDTTWNENINWRWRFKGDDVWLSLDIQGGKHVVKGEVRYLPDRKVYQLTITDTKKQSAVFEGSLDPKGYLVFEREDKATGETQQYTMNTAAEGVRFIYRYATKAKGTAVFNRQYLVAGTKVGESLGASAKKHECVVTGGLGVMTVSYQGETYYVCCTGCRDAFNEDPAKYVKEFKERKKKN